ncbi:hypothetical protein C8Q77DRAFT_1134712 [Trametes polyzona]|nr:hypothetical protein C8Q77DRAFT_1134712 [Trametes polyzona]
MKSEFSTSWIPIQKSSTARHQTELHQSNSHQLPPSSPLLTPRTAAPGNRANSFAASFRSVFQRTPHRATSASSLHSAYSANSSAKSPSYTASDSASLHPYASMVAAPLPVVSSHDASDEEEECPVCLEPLSSSFRLPGEKPHIVPECGHALHEVSSLPCRCPSGRVYLSCFVPHVVDVPGASLGRDALVFGSTPMFPTSAAPLHSVVPGAAIAIRYMCALEWCLRLTDA